MIELINNTLTVNNSTELLNGIYIISSVWEILLAIIIGAAVIVIGQAILKFLINPIIAQYDVINEIKCALIYYADVMDGPGSLEDKQNDGSKKLRHLSSLLRAKTSHIRLYEYLVKIKLVKSYKDILKVSENLIGISNSLNMKENRDRIVK